MKLYIPNSAFLGNIDPFLQWFDPTEPDKLEITFNDKWISIHPLVLSMTAALGMSVREAGGRIQCHQTTARSMPYLVRMKLFDYLGVASELTLQEHESAGRFIPLTNIKDGVSLTTFIEELVPLLHTNPNQADSIKYTISELVRNVLEHAQATQGAIVCAQYFKKSNRISIGVADTGVGVKKTISVSYPVTSDGEAIKLALIPGVTGTTSRPGGTEVNAGAGLFFIKSIAKVNQNFFVVCSGKGMYKLLKTRGAMKLYSDPTDDNHSFREDLPYWQGTAVGVDITVDNNQDFAELLALIRGVYRLDVRDRIKSRYKKARFI